MRLKHIPSSRRFKPCDKSGLNIDLPLSELLQLQFRFASAVRWLSVVSEISNHGQKLNTPPTQLLGLSARSGIWHQLAHCVLTIWLLFPCVLRCYLYGKLRLLGRRWYGETDLNTQKLPLGVYLKFGPDDINDKHLGKFRALQIVRQHTSISVPYPMDCVTLAGESFLLTSAIPGEPLGLHLDRFSGAVFDGKERYKNELEIEDTLWRFDDPWS